MTIITELIKNALRDIIPRHHSILGDFHTEMSFLGCIGYLMAASGLQDLLELIYAPNSVVHMLSGKAVVQEVRGFLNVDAALNTYVGTKIQCTSTWVSKL